MIKELPVTTFTIFLTCFFLFFSGSANSQESETITFSEHDRCITINEKSVISPLTVFQEYKSEFRLNTEDEMTLLKVKEDQYGYTHYYYQQEHKGIKVEGGVYSIHAKDNRMVSGNGEIIENLDVSVNPTIRESTAKQIALDRITELEINKYSPQANVPTLAIDDRYPLVAELVIGRRSADTEAANNSGLMYRVRVKVIEPSDYMYYVYIDAHSGEILHMLPGFFGSTGTVNTLYNGTRSFESKWTGSTTKYKLIDETRGDGIETKRKRTGTNKFLNDSDNDWNNNRTKRIHASTHWAAQAVWDIYVNNFSRNGPDGSGIGLDIWTNVGGSPTDIGNSSAVATDPLELTIVGDVSGTTDARCSLDGIGHEFTHGVGFTEAGWEVTSTFLPESEAYAIMEGTCDIFGEVAEFYIQGTVDWQFDGGVISDNDFIRTFSPPVLDGQSALEFGDANWTANDEGHFRGGVLRYWFFLLANGGIGTNHLGNDFCVRGIGIPKAAQIVYQTLNSGGFSTTTTFAAARNVTAQRAGAIYGANSNERAQVLSAWYAVAVGAIFTGTVEYNGLTVNGVRTIQHNNEVILNNLNVGTGGDLTVTSGTQISIKSTSGVNSGGYFHGFITPTCAGGAKMGNTSNMDNQDEYLNTQATSLGESEEIDNVSAFSSIKVYPNPSVGVFTISNIDGDVVLQVSDFTGRVIYTDRVVNESHTRIDLQESGSGIYILTLITKGEANTYKVVVSE